MPLRLDGSKRTVRGCEVGRGCKKKKRKRCKKREQGFLCVLVGKESKGE